MAMGKERNVATFFSSNIVLSFFFSIILSPSPGFAKATLNQQDLDKIIELPGQPPISFNQFSGYVTVNEKHGRALFYWLTESPTDPDQKSLVLWLTGGPGCSSIAFGAADLIGPFRINKSGSSLYLNKYTWNGVANILFLESPAGVGFSYTNTTSDLTDSDDKRTAQDTLIFLLRWMSRFPQYKHRDFYITGESYAGHYVPQLAKSIQDHNKASSNPIINLKGFMVGNPATDYQYDNLGRVAYWWSHSMISDQSYRSILKHCNFTGKENTPQCDKALNYSMTHEFGSIDQYNLYTPPCLSTTLSSNASKGDTYPELVRLKNSLLRGHVHGYDPCAYQYRDKYYNRPDVQRALHANTTSIPYEWAACSEVLANNWKDWEFSMLATYKELMAAGLRIWLFSGDVDSIVPVTATRFSLSRLNLAVKTPWYPWYYADRQVGGWAEIYEGLTFVVVRGAGHEVPLLQRGRALQLFQSFLFDKNLPPKPAQSGYY